MKNAMKKSSSKASHKKSVKNLEVKAAKSGTVREGFPPGPPVKWTK